MANIPPKGWNSWDCYGASVTEKEVKANARYMAKHLKDCGYEYVIVDIQWYEKTADSSQYHDLAKLEMDDYARLMPAENRFPSAAYGRGFKELAQYVHNLGLKFGIHIMRGIPRQAIYMDCKILGTDISARSIADGRSVCPWNTDMYGVNMNKKGAQEYYNSLFQLYASWGVDFVKVDDIAHPYSAKEVEGIRKAIKNSGRDMILSLSPGEASIENAEHLMTHADMWRISGDFWDIWRHLYYQFELCHKWEPYIGKGTYPDADMIPVGHIGIRSVEHGKKDRRTDFTPDEQKTLMSLWCMFHSPLFLGCELNDNDDFTLKLITNKEILKIGDTSKNNRQLSREDDLVIWGADGEDCRYLAFFNLTDQVKTVTHPISGNALELWTNEQVSGEIKTDIPVHGVKIYKIS